jgi:hypothetical protein
MDRFSEELYGNRSLPEGEVEPACDNCSRVDYDLRRVDESATSFHACDECYGEIMALFDREAEGRELYACDRQILAAFRKPSAAVQDLQEQIEDEAECEHLNVHVEEGEDVNDEYVMHFEMITCRDCGQELIETSNGELEARKRRAA